MDLISSLDKADEREGRRWLEAWGLPLLRCIDAFSIGPSTRYDVTPDVRRVMLNSESTIFRTPEQAHRAIGWYLRWRRTLAAIPPVPQLFIAGPQLSTAYPGGYLRRAVGRALVDLRLVWLGRWSFVIAPLDLSTAVSGDVLAEVFTGVYYYDLVLCAQLALGCECELVLQGL